MSEIDSLYLHFPFCAHLCNYCDFYKQILQKKEYDLHTFHEYLEQSFERHRLFLVEQNYQFSPLQTFYLGGGTPSLWGDEGALFLQHFLKEKEISLAQNCEFTMEVNPKTWTPKSIESFLNIGVNRFSVGIQSLNQNFLPLLDRVHDLEDALKTLRFFKEEQVNFSIDLMLGLPYSMPLKRNIIEELKLALEYKPKHFSIYILTVKENYPHYQYLPSEEFIEEEYLQMADFLKLHHFNHYEVSNFSLDGFESKHNLRYWNSESVAALGASATGFLSEKKIRYKWKTKKVEFETEFLTNEEFLLEKIYMALRTSYGLNLSDYMEEERSKGLIQKWIQNGYVERSNDSFVSLNSRGFLMLDSLMNDYFIKTT